MLSRSHPAFARLDEPAYVDNPAADERRLQRMVTSESPQGRLAYTVQHQIADIRYCAFRRRDIRCLWRNKLDSSSSGVQG